MDLMLRPPKPRKRLSLSKKLNIIQELEGDSKPTKRSLARRYNVNESTIRCIFSNRVKIKRMSEKQNDNCSAAKSKTFKQSIHPEFNKLSLEWIDSLYKNQLPLTSNQISEKAETMAFELKIGEDSFKASSHGSVHFKELNGLKTMNPFSVCVDDKNKNDALTSELESFYCYIKNFESHNVYNMVETGLFYDLLPAPVDELLDGVFQSKGRVNLIMCANATGSHKIPCTVIENENDDSKWLGIHTIRQEIAVMDEEIFYKWLFYIFCPQIKNRTTQPVVLLVDSSMLRCASEISIENITVKSMPVFCTSDMIPLNSGVIHAFKVHYKHMLVKEAIDWSVKINSKSQQYQNMKPLQVNTLAKRIIKSWNMVHTEVIKRAFVQADLKLNLVPGQKGMFDEYEAFSDIFSKLNIKMTRTEMLNYFCLDNTDSSAYLDSIMNFNSNNETNKSSLTTHQSTDSLSVCGTENDLEICESANKNNTCHFNNGLIFSETKGSHSISKDNSTSGIGKGCGILKVDNALNIGQTSVTYTSNTMTKLGIPEANNKSTDIENQKIIYKGAKCPNNGKVKNNYDKLINDYGILSDKEVLSKFREMYQQTNKWELDISGEEAELFAGKLYGELQSSLKTFQSVLEKINKNYQR